MSRRGVFQRPFSAHMSFYGENNIYAGSIFNNASSVQSERILYTPSAFARGSLLHLQEVGSLKAVHPHTSMRTDLVSYLCFLVLEGEGNVTYEGHQYKLKQGIVCLLIAANHIAIVHLIIYGRLPGAIFTHHFFRLFMKI